MRSCENTEGKERDGYAMLQRVVGDRLADPKMRIAIVHHPAVDLRADVNQIIALRIFCRIVCPGQSHDRILRLPDGL
jgi:hypothetical protein